MYEWLEIVNAKASSNKIITEENAKSKPPKLAKKESAGRMVTPQGSQLNSRYLSDSTINIVDFLYLVNDTFPDILPKLC